VSAMREKSRAPAGTVRGLAPGPAWPVAPLSWEGMVRAVERVRIRLRRAAAALEVFLDGPQASPRDAVHLVFAGEHVRPHYAVPAPDVTEAESTPHFRLLSLPALVRMKLTSFRDKDRVHLRDLIGVGLVDASWIPQLHPELAARLRTLLETPEG